MRVLHRVRVRDGLTATTAARPTGVTAEPPSLAHRMNDANPGMRGDAAFTTSVVRGLMPAYVGT